MRANDLLTRLLIFSTLFLLSCESMYNKEYKYIVTSMETYLLTTSPKEQKPLLISAASDSAAYVTAYLNFCFAAKYYNREFKKSGAKAGKPLSFRLLNQDSIDIARSVSFLNKTRIEKNIRRKVAEYETPENE